MFADQPDLPPSSRHASGPAPERASPSSDGSSFGNGDLPGQSFDHAADDAIKHDGGLRLTFQGDEPYQIAVGNMGETHCKVV